MNQVLELTHVGTLGNHHAGRCFFGILLLFAPTIMARTDQHQLSLVVEVDGTARSLSFPSSETADHFAIADAFCSEHLVSDPRCAASIVEKAERVFASAGGSRQITDDDQSGTVAAAARAAQLGDAQSEEAHDFRRCSLGPLLALCIVIMYCDSYICLWDVEPRGE